jgi:hypothetical protein
MVHPSMMCVDVVIVETMTFFDHVAGEHAGSPLRNVVSLMSTDGSTNIIA